MALAYILSFTEQCMQSMWRSGFILVVCKYPDSVVLWSFCRVAAQAWFDKNSRNTDSWLGLKVLILIRISNSKQL